MPHVLPRRVATLATRGFIASAAAQAAVAATSVWGMWPDNHTNLLAFGMCMTVTVVTGLAAILARCQVAVARAFAAGIQAGRAVPPLPAPREPVPAFLRVVE